MVFDITRARMGILLRFCSCIKRPDSGNMHFEHIQKRPLTSFVIVYTTRLWKQQKFPAGSRSLHVGLFYLGKRRMATTVTFSQNSVPFWFLQCFSWNSNVATGINVLASYETEVRLLPWNRTNLSQWPKVGHVQESHAQFLTLAVTRFLHRLCATRMHIRDTLWCMIFCGIKEGMSQKCWVMTWMGNKTENKATPKRHQSDAICCAW